MPAFANPGTPFVKGLLPIGSGYESFSQPTTFSESLGGRCQGAKSFRDADGTVFTFAGYSTKLKKLSGTSWADVSGATYTTGSDERWSFTQFGRNIIATNYNDVMQNYLMGTSSVFAALAGTPPKARYITTLREFVVVGNTTDGVYGAVPHRVQWSAQGNSTDWVPDAATQSDFQDLDATDGFIKQVVGGEYGVIFQERAITRMTYVGSPLVFQFDKVETDRGTQAPGSVVKVGNLIYYIGTDLKFYVFDGTRSTPIGANKVDQTFADSIDKNYLHRIKGIRDPEKPLIYFFCPANGSYSGSPYVIWVYNYSTNRFSYIDFSIVSLGIDEPFLLYSAGYTLDGLDAISTDLDSLPYSLDSELWTGGKPSIAGFLYSDNYLQVFDGTPLLSQICTGLMELNDGQRTNIQSFRPVCNTKQSQVTITINQIAAIRSSNLLTDSTVTGGTLTLNAEGFYRCRTNARYHQIFTQITSSSDSYHTTGIELLHAPAAGKR